MWRSATSSEAAGGLLPVGAHRTALLPRAGVAVLAVALVALLSGGPAGATVFLTVDEALDLAFPGCTIERGTVYLEEAELERARELAGGEISRAIVHPYAARCPGQGGGTTRAGTAYFDTHRVRTLPETVMVVVGPAGEVERVEVLSFQEPPDYIPREIWYQQFEGRELSDDLELKRGIHPVTGATLTARATTDAVRRVLALHRVLGERAGGQKGAGKR